MAGSILRLIGAKNTQTGQVISPDQLAQLDNLGALQALQASRGGVGISQAQANAALVSINDSNPQTASSFLSTPLFGSVTVGMAGIGALAIAAGTKLLKLW